MAAVTSRYARALADVVVERKLDSAKTVEVYLSRVYAKTGYASRVKLVQAVASGTLTL